MIISFEQFLQKIYFTLERLSEYTIVSQNSSAVYL